MHKAVPNTSAACYTMLSEYHQSKNSYIWITKTQQESKEVFALLQFLSEVGGAFDQFKPTLYHIYADDELLTTALYSLLQQERGIYVVCEEYLEDLQTALQLLNTSLYTIKNHQRMSPRELRHLLADYGYENSAEGIIGTMKVRGESIHIHSPEYSHGIRVLFDE